LKKTFVSKIQFKEEKRKEKKKKRDEDKVLKAAF
jgi:hypothetical protein